MPHEHESDLALYRLSMANEMLDAARNALEYESYKTANNRAYYAIFHAMRAELALDRIDFKHHSGVISYFSQYYLATEIFPKTFSRMIRNASLLRSSSDYDDFYICSKEDTLELVADAKTILNAVSKHIELRLHNEV